jgi:DNA-binding transcriptional regulator YdaS (Cro superfamily)
MDNHRAILTAIGDYKAIAKRLGVHPTSVIRWRSEGIPPEYWPALCRMARALHVPGVTIALIETTSPRWNRLTSSVS